MDDLGGAFQMELDSGNGKTAQEAQADDEDDAAGRLLSWLSSKLQWTRQTWRHAR